MTRDLHWLSTGGKREYAASGAHVEPPLAANPNTRGDTHGDLQAKTRILPPTLAARRQACCSRSGSPTMSMAAAFGRIILLATTLAAGMAAAGGPWRASEANTRGWQLMSPEERIEHQRRVRSFTTLDECRVYQRSHHDAMVQRARQRGLPLPDGGRDICAHLQPDGSGR